MDWFYADPAHHRRLMRVVDRHLGHHLLGRAEDTKIALSASPRIDLDLDEVEDGLSAPFDRSDLDRALSRPVDAIVAAAHETVRRAGVPPDAIGALYFTGGSTGLAHLSRRLAAGFPAAEAVFGDRYASVVGGLGIEAAARFGKTDASSSDGMPDSSREMFHTASPL